MTDAVCPALSLWYLLVDAQAERGVLRVQLHVQRALVVRNELCVQVGVGFQRLLA